MGTEPPTVTVKQLAAAAARVVSAIEKVKAKVVHVAASSKAQPKFKVGKTKACPLPNRGQLDNCVNQGKQVWFASHGSHSSSCHVVKDLHHASCSHRYPAAESDHHSVVRTFCIYSPSDDPSADESAAAW